jgi:hypothetical protein
MPLLVAFRTCSNTVSLKYGLASFLAEKVRAVIIRDTMHTTDFLVSDALARETEKLSYLKEMTPCRIAFSSSGDLIAPGP